MVRNGFPEARNGWKSNTRPYPENTYSILFAAARSPTPTHTSTSTSTLPPRPQPNPIQSTTSTSTSSSSHQPTRTQSSLNAFWQHLPPAPPPASSPPHLSSFRIPRCEDCDIPLYPPSFSSDDIDMGGMGDGDERELGREFECGTCRKRVCGMCAVLDGGGGGEGRECLECRSRGGGGGVEGKKHWVGGIGWMP